MSRDIVDEAERRQDRSDDVVRTLHSVGQKFEALMHNVPMATIDDLPVGMQRHVMGVPRPWVQLFQRLENVIVCYDRVHQPQA
jgi:hypothetical protein